MIRSKYSIEIINVSLTKFFSNFFSDLYLVGPRYTLINDDRYFWAHLFVITTSGFGERGPSGPS